MENYFEVKTCSVPVLPDSFTVIQPVYLPTTATILPITREEVSKKMVPIDNSMVAEMAKENDVVETCNCEKQIIRR